MGLFFAFDQIENDFNEFDTAAEAANEAQRAIDSSLENGFIVEGAEFICWGEILGHAKVEQSVSEPDRFILSIEDLRQSCRWAGDRDDIGSFVTGCGGQFRGTHDFKFCPYCGRPVGEVWDEGER